MRLFNRAGVGLLCSSADGKGTEAGCCYDGWMMGAYYFNPFLATFVVWSCYFLHNITRYVLDKENNIYGG